MHLDQQTEAVKRAAVKWWAEIRELGEERTLALAAASGESPAQAELLAERYPASALEPIVVGLRAAENRWSRTRMVRILARLEGDGPVPALLVEMRTGPHRSSRVAAATELLKRGLESAVPVMIEEWRKTAGRLRYAEGGIEELIVFLLSSGSIDAVQALTEDWEKRPVFVRYKVIESTDDIPETTPSGLPLPGQIREAVEDLLAAALLDRSVRSGLTASWGGVSFSNPRLCDMAGLLLSRIFPDGYQFDIEAPLAERDTRIERLRETYGLFLALRVNRR